MKFSIRWTLILGFLGLIWMTHVITMTSAYVTSQKVLRQHARDIMENIANLAMQQSYNHLNHAHSAAVLTRRLISAQIVGGSENAVPLLEQYFYNNMALYPQFAGIFLGLPNGNFYDVRRHGGPRHAVYRTKIITHADGSRQTRLIWRDKDFKVISQEADPGDDYDPRKRPWYIKAAKVRNIVWTDPYIFFSSRKPGITTAGPSYSRSGQLIGIVGVDIEIDRLSKFIGSLRIGKNGRAFMLNRNGDVVAHPDLEKLKYREGSDGENIRLVKINELDDAVSREAIETASLINPENGDIELTQSRFTLFKSHGRTYHAMFTPFTTWEWPWLICVYLPEDDYLGAIKENRRLTIILTLLISCVATVIGLFMARGIIRPISLLATASNSIKNNRFDLIPPIGSRYREIQTTADSFALMKDAVQTSELNKKLIHKQTELQEQNKALHKVREALSKSEERFRVIASTTSDYFYSLSVESDGTMAIDWIDGAFGEITGYKPGEIETVEDWFGVIHIEDRSGFEEMTRKMRANQRHVAEYRIVTKSGEERWLRDYSQLVPDKTKGRIQAVICAVRDITQYKHAGIALRESDARYQFFASHFKGIVFRSAIDLSFEYLHGAVEEITGYTEENFVGGLLKWKQLIHGDDVSKLTEILKYLTDTSNYTTEVEYRIVHKNGSAKWVNQYIQNICDGTGKPHSVIGIIYDITEQKHLEEQFRQSQMLKAVASLAGGIAHEFNNALVGITGNLELLKMGIEVTPKRSKHLDGIKTSAQRMALLTDQLLAYARGGRYQTEIVSLNEFVRETLPLLMHTTDSSVRIETDLPQGVSHIKGDLTQLRMALSAALANASESMEGGGRVRVITRNKRVRDSTVDHVPALPPGQYVCLTIQDEGAGMDEETRKRVFEPFFTTKFQGRGLGMAAAYGIIKNHDGNIRIESHPEQGTLVHFFLPAVQGGSGVVSDDESRMVTGSGRVLVVDDEPMVLEICRSMLEKLGYHVICADTGSEAIDRVREHRDGIDLVLLDIKLPDMGGNEVFRQIRRECPEMKVIICSGYALDDPITKILDAGANDFIQKPFSMNALSLKVKKWISERRC